MSKKEYIILFLSLAFLLSVIAIGLLFLYPSKEKNITETGKLFEYVKSPPVKEEAENQDSSIFVIKPRASEEVRQRLLERSQENQATPPAKQNNLFSQPSSSIKTQKSSQADQTPQTPIVSIPSSSPLQKIKKPYAKSVKKQSVQKISVKSIPYVTPSGTLPGKTYWIQLLATESKRRILQARKDLQLFHIYSLINLQENKTKLLYRLRVGPFPHEGEANQTMNWILDGKAFSDAYIIQEK